MPCVKRARGLARIAFTAWLILASTVAARTQTLSLLPENPRYFSWRGEPLLIVGSAEHYGAVLNADFDYPKYLATLSRDGLNHTRLFTGATYVEPQGAFNIARNTLAPAGPRYLAPWARTTEPGYSGGGNRFDLTQWNEAYFARLRDFVRVAGQNNVIVEVNLFCPFYEESQWLLSPFHPDNNVNDAGKDVARTNVYTLDNHGGLLIHQERFVDRVVEELKDFDNLYYEICNEPYFGGVTLEWQAHIGQRISSAQSAHSKPKLISQNIANNKARVERALPHVSIYNFHYAAPPTTIALNWHLRRPIGDNETGFRGTNDAPYRMEAWDFLVAGGALFSHLDYSFSVGHEDGTFRYPSSQPGGGNADLRRQFRRLREFIEAFDLTRSGPDDSVIAGGVPSTHSARAFVEPGSRVGVYFRPLTISQYSVRWTGTIEVPETAEYELFAASNDGIRVWIDDHLVIDRWVEQSESEHSVTHPLAEGRHRFKVEYFYNGGQAAAKLAWSRPGTERGPIPASAFRLPDDSGPGLRGEYFAGSKFDEPWRTRVDPRIHFEWGTDSPIPLPEAGAGTPAPVNLRVPAGRWRIAWIDPVSGEILSQESRRHESGTLSVNPPAFKNDIVLQAVRRQ